MRARIPRSEQPQKPADGSMPGSRWPRCVRHVRRSPTRHGVAGALARIGRPASMPGDFRGALGRRPSQPPRPFSRLMSSNLVGTASPLRFPRVDDPGMVSSSTSQGEGAPREASIRAYSHHARWHDTRPPNAGFTCGRAEGRRRRHEAARQVQAKVRLHSLIVHSRTSSEWFRSTGVRTYR
jgi:hypothetical protein